MIWFNRGLSRAQAFVAALLILFGSAEVITAYRHSFFWLRTAEVPTFTGIGAGLGLCYVGSGLLLTLYRRYYARAAVGLLVIDFVGRIGIVAAGLFPVDNPRQVIGIGLGTLLTVVFAVLILRWSRAMP